MTDALGSVTRLEHSVEGKLTARTLPDGARESWRWDGEGNLVEHVNAIGGVTAFGHTHFDKLAWRTTPDGATYTFDHDTELRLTKVTGPTGLISEAGQIAWQARATVWGTTGWNREATATASHGVPGTHSRTGPGRGRGERSGRRRRLVAAPHRRVRADRACAGCPGVGDRHLSVPQTRAHA
jgi:YD repeat-containing protein